MKLRFSLAFVVAGLVILSSSAWAQEEEQRAKLSGNWEEQGGATQTAWTIEQQGDNTVRVTSSQGDKKLAEFSCDLGKQCDAKDAGRKVKVLLYFNGSKLVVTETRGDQVVKLLFGFGQAADVLEVETIPMAPAGATQTAHFTRVSTTTAAKQ